MRKESWNIAIACFIGGMLGVLVAVKIAALFGLAPYTAPWFIAGFAGAIAGGIGAYIFYDLPAVFAAMRNAWYELADMKNLKRLGKAALSELWSLVLLFTAIMASSATIIGIVALYAVTINFVSITFSKETAFFTIVPLFALFVIFTIASLGVV